MTASLCLGAVMALLAFGAIGTANAVLKVRLVE